MGLRFDTNARALKAGRLMDRSDQELTRWLERLVSRLPINRTAGGRQGPGIAVAIPSKERGRQRPRPGAQADTSPNQPPDDHPVSSRGIQGALDEATTASAIGMIDAAIKSAATLCGSSDAYRNRIEFAINRLATQQENSTAARSAIRDAGIAAQTIAFTQGKILVNADSSVRVQANVAPQTAMTLLG